MNAELFLLGHKMDSHDIEHLQELRKAYRTRLNALELQAAKLGLATPAHIVLEIQHVTNEISAIDNRLAGLQGASTNINEPPTVADDVNRQMFIKIRNALSNLYRDESSIRRILFDAGFNESNFRLGGSAIETWHAILKELHKHSQIAQLLLTAIKEYEDNDELKKAWKNFCEQ